MQNRSQPKYMLFVGKTYGQGRHRLYRGRGIEGGKPREWQEARKGTFLKGVTDQEILKSAIRAARDLYVDKNELSDTTSHYTRWARMGDYPLKAEAPSFEYELLDWDAYVDPIIAERRRRTALWTNLTQRYPEGKDVPKKVINDAAIYYGGSGCWVNKDVTSEVDATYGVTVSVLHTGSDYPDDLGEEGLIYHYPVTKRPAARDLGEIEATKNCYRLQIPLFVVTEEARELRRVRLGWVLNWNDNIESFYISFDSSHAIETSDEMLPPQTLEKVWRRVLDRPGKEAFKYSVLSKYGACCAFCGISEIALIDAIHIRDHAKNGPMHDSNGLPACKNHHAAFDKGLLAILVDDLRLEALGGHNTLEELGVTRNSLAHLPSTPSSQYLEWAYENKRRKS